VDKNGKSYDTTRVMTGNGTVAGLPVYRLRITQGNDSELRTMTVAGLDLVNDTGFVTELLRFPLVVNATWVFGSDNQFSTDTGHRDVTYRQSYSVNVTLLGRGLVTIAAGTLPAWHVHAEAVYKLGTMTRHMSMDYWYADGAKDIVRIDQTFDDDSKAWEELYDAQFV